MLATGESRCLLAHTSLGFIFSQPYPDLSWELLQNQGSPWEKELYGEENKERIITFTEFLLSARFC